MPNRMRSARALAFLQGVGGGMALLVVAGFAQFADQARLRTAPVPWRAALRAAVAQSGWRGVRFRAFGQFAR